MEKDLKIANNEKYILYMNKEQYDYLLLVLTGLYDVEKKIPKKFKTKNSNILIDLYNNAKEIQVSFEI